MTTVQNTTEAAVATADTPVPPKRIAILAALGLANGLPIWREQSFITDRHQDLDQRPILSLDFDSRDAALVWAAHLGPVTVSEYTAWSTFHAEWHGWAVLLGAHKPKPAVLDEETAALAAQLAATVNTKRVEDPHRNNPDVHYRLYRALDGEPVVICVQDYDYPDYDVSRFLSPEAWATEVEADAALERFCDVAEAAAGGAQ